LKLSAGPIKVIEKVIMFPALHETGSGTSATSGHVYSNDRFWGQSRPDMLNSNFSGFDRVADLGWRKACIVLAPPWDAPAIARSRYAGDADRYPRRAQ
jgi:hypothetical protein